MKVKVQPRPQTITQARAELSRRLEARREEIEAAVMTRVYSVSDTTDLDPTYAEGLKAAVTAAVDYGFAAIELGEERSPSPPPILLTQARLAARNGIGLDTVLRRYFAGHALLGDYLIEEAEREGLLDGVALQRLLRTQAVLFDRLLVAVSNEHTQATQKYPPARERRRVELIERLLAGELVNTSGFAYDFEGFHLGAIAVGDGAGEALRALASALDYRPLLISRGEETVWAWLGSQRRRTTAGLGQIIAKHWPTELALALGEPAPGLGGWRLTCQQAQAALPIALRGIEPVVRYADVALLASMLQDELLATSLRELYLVPLGNDRDGGETLQATLRAYFKSDRNVSSAAAALGVSRQTVGNRLRSVEERLGRPLAVCAAELQATLQLESIGLSAEELTSDKVDRAR